MWKKKPGHEHDHVDARTGTHHVVLHNSLTDAQHEVQIFLGVEKCPACGTCWPLNDVGAIDAKALVERELAKLAENHAAVMAYAARHGVALKVGIAAKHGAEHSMLKATPEHKLISAPKRAE